MKTRINVHVMVVKISNKPCISFKGNHVFVVNVYIDRPIKEHSISKKLRKISINDTFSPESPKHLQLMSFLLIIAINIANEKEVNKIKEIVQPQRSMSLFVNIKRTISISSPIITFAGILLDLYGKILKSITVFINDCKFPILPSTAIRKTRPIVIRQKDMTIVAVSKSGLIIIFSIR
jgi:hypothetical protein